MANDVYTTVCEALSRIVSRRAAENIVTEALRGAKTDANRVTAAEMQALLKSAVFARLQQIIPVAQAKGEIKQILNTLEKGLSHQNQALTPEVLEGLAALQNEFKPYAKLSQPRAERLRRSLAELPQATDPVKMLNTLWAELDLLQLELSGRAYTPDDSPLDSRNLDELLLSSGEYAIPFDLEAPPLPNTPIAAEPSAPLPAALKAAAVAQVAQPNPLIVSAAPTSPLVAGVRPASHFALHSSEGRERLLHHFALEEGVVGVLLTNRRGDVLAELLSSGDADQLAAVVAATTLLLEKRRRFTLFYTHLAEVSAFIGQIGDSLLTVLSNDRVNVGRVLSEMTNLKEEV